MAQATRGTARHRKHLLPLVVLAAMAVAGWALLGDALTFDTLRDNRDWLLAFRDENYLGLALAFVGIYVAIVTFSLCGFANVSSIAIQIAVIGGLAPNQRPVVARLGPKALAAGSLSNLMSAALAGLMLPM